MEREPPSERSPDTYVRSLVALWVAVALALLGTTVANASPVAARPPVRVTLYAFFATWCIPCRAELPHLERLHRTYGDQGLRVVLVSEDAPSTAAAVPTFLARAGVTAEWMLDADSELLVRYDPTGNVPFAALVDENGAVRHAHAGYEPGDERALEAAVQAALAAPNEDDAAAGPPIAVSGMLQTLGVWRRSRFDPVDDGTLWAGVARLEVEGTYGRRTEAGCAPGTWCFGLRLRLDGALIADEVGPDAEDGRLERATLELQRGGVRLRLGDSYVQFGHGVSLSLRRVDTLGLDTSLQGGRVDWTIAPLRVTAIGGVLNPQNLDPIELEVVGDTSQLPVASGASDRLGGVEFAFSLGEFGEIAPYIVVATAPKASNDGRDVQWALAGGSATLDFEGVHIAFDGAAGRRTGLKPRAETPWAVYGAVSFDLGPTTTLVEAKAYRRWSLGRVESASLYHEPPTLERADQEVPENRDVLGGRLRFEWRVTPRVAAYASGLVYRFASDGSDPLDGGLAIHGYGGVGVRPSDRVDFELAGGYRRETDRDGDEKRSLWHLDADLQWAITPHVALTAKLNHRSETKALFSGPHEFEEGLAVVGVAIPGLLAVSALYGWSTEAAVLPTHYPGAEIRFVLPRGGELRLFGGRLVGGRVCVSGSCREVPPFEGARLDAVLRW